MKSFSFLFKRYGMMVQPQASIRGGSEMMQEVAEDVTGLRVAGAGHWVPEEQLDALVAALLELARR